MRTIPVLLTIMGCLNSPAIAAGQISDRIKWPEQVVATIDGVPIKGSDLDQILGDRLLKLRTDEYNIEKSILEEHIDDRLLKLEAFKREISVDELMAIEVYTKIAVVQALETNAVYESSRERYANLKESDALPLIADTIRQQRVARRKAEFMVELRQRYRATIGLAPPRAKGDLARGPSTGPSDAVITIVEFSEFQCPFCAQVQATLRRLQNGYPGTIRLCFRHFPLPMHSGATKAAEAALCADEQNRFWEMHDKLFANQSRLATQDLDDYATQLGLDRQAFSKCLASGSQAKNWRLDKSVGSQNGVASTPTFFINGRLIIGAQSFETFSGIIEEELRIAKLDGR